jgi:large subunit ribosomal protein L10
MDLGWEDLNGFLGQGTGIVFVYNKDIVKACKILVDFSKENENLQLRGGFLKTQKITPEELNALAKLPPKEILLGMVVNGFASPLMSFMSAMNNIILKFLWVVEEIKKTKTQE